MARFEVWQEGYSATGYSAAAQRIGEVDADSFPDAVRLAVKEWATPGSLSMYFNANDLTFWGCRHFDNEADARRTFG